MHPVIADIRRLPWYAAIWLLVGGGMAILLEAAGLAGRGNALLFALPLCLLFGFMAPSAYYVCRALPPVGRRGLQQVVAAFGSAALLSAGLWLLAARVWNGIDRAGLVMLTPALRVTLFAGGFVLYLLSLLAHDLVLVRSQALEAERREALSRLSARDAELAVLRLQINPHFLFNSLHSISALAGFDPAAARAMAIELAEFYRRTLSVAGQKDIRLEEELALCRAYLCIEQRRFGDKLAFRIDADPAALDRRLPPMLLQPLVENAVKHGIQDLDAPGEIRIDASLQSDWLHLRIVNPRNPDAPARAGEGVGLANVRDRLAALQGACRVDTRHAGTFVVALDLPREVA